MFMVDWRWVDTSDKTHNKGKSGTDNHGSGSGPRQRSNRKNSHNRIRPDSTGKYVDEKNENMSNSKSMDNLREWSEKDKRRKRRNKVSLATSQSSINFHTVARMSSPLTDCNDVFDHTSSPFQKAVEATGILNSPRTPIKGRRMSREEIVTAAILSQMKSKKQSRKSNKISSKVTTVQEGTMNGWEAEDGKMLKSKQIDIANNSVEIPKLATKVEPYRPAILMKNSQKKSNKSSSHRSRNIKAEKAWRTSEIDIISDDHLHQIQSRRSISAEHLDNTSAFRNPNEPLRSFPSLHTMPYQKQPADVNGVAFYSRHPISYATSHINEKVKSPIFPVARYDASPTTQPEKWINITRYSPEHSPQPIKSGFVKSPNSNNTSKSDINEILSAGINANPKLLGRYDSPLSFSAKVPDVAVYSNTRTRTSSRPEAYFVDDDFIDRRRSVNMGVQTEESRLV